MKSCFFPYNAPAEVRGLPSVCTVRGPGNPHFTGAIDEVAVFNRVLAARDLSDLAGAR